ncbi:hypothetical protein [uncultured Mailhella sp.]|uniref:hypothetical protein n=1 Tax=uncultured Mailhella sp. TaxID=1981031 RepID=UPI0025F96EB3|nr:hypothetical protein [uncultured Mailhella sp.]
MKHYAPLSSLRCPRCQSPRLIPLDFLLLRNLFRVKVLGKTPPPVSPAKQPLICADCLHVLSMSDL